MKMYLLEYSCRGGIGGDGRFWRYRFVQAVLRGAGGKINDFGSGNGRTVIVSVTTRHSGHLIHKCIHIVLDIGR